MTLGIAIGFVKLILAHAAAVHELPVKVDRLISRVSP